MKLTTTTFARAISALIFLFLFTSALAQIQSTVIGQGAFGTYYGANRNYSVHIGYQAGWSSTYTGSGYNTFIGYRSGYSITSGINNTFLGSQSGYRNTSGQKNTFIGRQAGFNNQSGSSNVFLGYNAGFGETGSNKLYIDNGSTSQPLIWGDFSSNSLKFNGTAQVTGSFNPSGGFVSSAFLDDDNSLGGNNDDWIRFNGYIEMKSNTDNYGIVLRESGGSGYMGITQKGGWSYFADSNISSNYFMRGNGDDVQVKDNLKAASISTRNYNTSGGIMNLSAGGYGMNFYIDTDNNSSDVYRWYGNGAEKMRLTDDGKLGIGVTPSSYKLHVAGDVYADGGWLRTSGQRGMYSQSYATYIYANDANYWRTRSDRGLIIANKANTIKGYLHHDNANSFGLLDSSGKWSIRLEKNADTRFYIANSEKMRIRADGRVGIGTTEPGSELHVNGRITANSIAGLDLAGGGISGNNFNLSGVNEVVIADPGEGINFSGDQKMYVIDDATDDKFYIGPGNVGIGLTPAEKLHINGAIRGHVSGGALEIKSSHGSTVIGAQNVDWSHFSTDRPKFYFDKGVIVDEGIVASYDEDLELRTDFRDGNILGATISGTTGNTTIHNDLKVDGHVTLNKSTVIEDNTQDDLLVMRGDGTFASRSVASIESPWLFTEILVGTDSMLAICPDAGVIGQVYVDVIDLNGNLRFGDNAYIDDDLDYGDDGDNDDIPDDWMKFSDRIEFKSVADDYGIVLFDQVSYTDFLNLHHSQGTSYLSNGSGGSNFFLKSTGRDVEFGGTVNIPSLETSEYASSESLTISADGDNNSTGEAIVFGTDGKAGEATFNEIMRLEEGGGIIVSSLQENDAIPSLMVRDATTGRIYSREASTVGPWDEEESTLSYDGNIGIGLTSAIPTQNIDLAGTARLRGLASNTLTEEILVADANGVIHKRDYSTFSPWQLNADNGYFSTSRIGIGAANLDADVSTSISTDLGTGLSVSTSNIQPNTYGIRSTVAGDNVKAIAAVNTLTGTDVFRVYGSGIVEAKEVLVSVNVWNDHVFYPTYDLMPLEKVEEYVKENHHLPEIPSEKEVLENGVNVGEMEGLLLKKVEELTLYIIEQNKQLKEQAELLKKQSDRIEKLESKLN